MAVDMGLGNRVAVVTGAGRGLGAGIARALAGEGARVAVVDLNAQDARRVAEGLGDCALPVEADVTERRCACAMAQRVVEVFGRIDILVNNVGLSLVDWVEDIQDADIERTFATNMKSHLLCTQAVIGPMKAARWGRLIYIASGSGLRASAGLALYSASKYFIRGLGIAVGLELGQHNITANIVCPSDVYSDENDAPQTWLNPKLQAISMAKEGVSSFEALRAKRIASNPMRRSCTVRDVADLVTFLAGDRAGFINAQSIAVNGGGVPT
jgi:NAD(P)-dependent dehydrogenase (short-subunit alcohol dehydrogenase family)